MLGWGSPRAMRRALSNNEVAEAEKFYEDFHHYHYPMPVRLVELPDDEQDDDKKDDDSVPWDADVIHGELT